MVQQEFGRKEASYLKALITFCVVIFSVRFYFFYSDWAHWHNFLLVSLPAESQPKKIRKMPPGLPSSVSTNMQKALHHFWAAAFIPRDPNFSCLAPFFTFSSTSKAFPWLAQQQRCRPSRFYSCASAAAESKRNKREKPLIYQVIHLQHVFIVCCISGAFGLWPHFIPSAKSSHQIPEEDSYKSLKIFIPPPHFFFSVSLSGHHISLFFPHPTPFPSASLSSPAFTTINNSPPPFSCSLPHPLSQLPVELAAVQDSADGLVIRSASPCSLFSSLSSSFPRLIKQLKKSFVQFAQMYFKYSLILDFGLK